MSLARFLTVLLLTAGLVANAFQYNPEPTGGIRLVWKLIKLDRDIEKARAAAEAKGATEEQYYAGYALSTDPDVRKMQHRLHYAALEYEELILRVIAQSKDPQQRAIAATAVGYTRPSHKQVDALVRATRDPDSSVRSNATRSLKVLLFAKPNFRSRIPTGVAID